MKMPVSRVVFERRRGGIRQGTRLVIAFIFGLGLINSAIAIPAFLKVLRDTYHFAPGSDADHAGCKNCHTTPPNRNAFGKDVKAALDSANADMLTPAILKTIEDKDSDGDGASNGDELRAGTNPGDPLSHPLTKGGSKKSSSAGAEQPPLIPLHTFHPALVHFPIALFLFGAFFEYLGWSRANMAFRDAGYWNMIGGAVSLGIVIPTGLIACFRQGFSLSLGQPVFTHFLLASSAAILMLIAVFWRKRGYVTHPGYYAVLAMACASLAAAGHFGGNLVY